MVADGPEDALPAEPDVPPSVRSLLVAAAADALGALDAALVPVALQRVRAFAPRRRATAGAAPLWRALVDDAGFRHAVAAAWSREHDSEPEPDAAPPDGLSPAQVREQAAGAFLLRPDGWQTEVERARSLDDTLRADRSARDDAARLRVERDRLARQVE
ncbi:MAG: NYN domain-containing protein, partial [Cellulosimicrobium funkei]